VVATSPDVKAKVPDGWAKVSAPSIPGLELADPAAFGPAAGGSTIVLGNVRSAADNSTLLPTGFIKAAGSLPDKQAVAIGEGLQAYRYRDVKLSGFGRPVTVYAVPTSTGVATLACVGGTAVGCDASANTMSLVSAKPFPVGPSAHYAKSVGDALGALGKAAKSGQAKLRAAKTPKAQAVAARSLNAAYGKAAAAVRGLEVSPADKLANAQLATALGSTAKAYGSAAKAAAKNDKGAYAKASKAVAAGQQSVSKALAGLKSAGYDVTT
jgi:hypothetical protein